MPSPHPLPENDGLAFAGERSWPPARLDDRAAQRLLRAENRCGRPNADVLRRRLSVVDGEPVAWWQVDFPEHVGAQEAALYEEPWRLVGAGGGSWRNPHLDSALRRALARIGRFLAMPAAAESPDWRWIDEEVLPDDSLVIVAREDDFTAGVLRSPHFAVWHAAHYAGLPPDALVESFPFPWSPATPLGALTSAQEELRHAVARASRGDDPAALAAAVARAYGWEVELGESDMLDQLRRLHTSRA